MSEWKKCKLKDICDIKSGKRLPKGSDFSPIPTEYKYIRARDIKNGVINADELVCISDEVKQKISKYIVCSNDIVITIVGASIGDVAYVTPQFDGVNLTENAVRLTKFKSQINPHYIFYILNSPEYHMLMQRIAAGAAQPKMGIYKVEAIEVAIPSIQIQNQIVEILSRYDSLIENYQKQIKLLEEAAQRLYKEWFVDLHFPGHENTKIIDGVPEGWEKKKVGDMISKIQRTKQVTANNYQASGKIPVIDQSRNFIAGYTDDAECLVKVTVPYIVFGDHTRILKYIPFSFAKGADGTQLIMSNDLERMPQTLFYNSLIEIDLSNYSYARHFKYLKEEFVLLPSEHIARKYDSIVSRYYQSIQKSREQIRLLTEARDRLLPKIMRGEIEFNFK